MDMLWHNAGRCLVDMEGCMYLLVAVFGGYLIYVVSMAVYAMIFGKALFDSGHSSIGLAVWGGISVALGIVLIVHGYIRKRTKRHVDPAE